MEKSDGDDGVKEKPWPLSLLRRYDMLVPFCIIIAYAPYYRHHSNRKHALKGTHCPGKLRLKRALLCFALLSYHNPLLFFTITAPCRYLVPPLVRSGAIFTFAHCKRGK